MFFQKKTAFVNQEISWKLTNLLDCEVRFFVTGISVFLGILIFAASSTKRVYLFRFYFYILIKCPVVFQVPS